MRMARIAIDKTYDFPQSRARHLAERLARDLEQRYDVAWGWEGDDIRFARPGVSERMHVGPTNIALDMRLGLLLTPFRATIEREVSAQLDKLAAGTPSA
jgi:putative polyhydroxyalkanoate system protein